MLSQHNEAYNMKNHNIRFSDKRLKAFLVKINYIKFYQFLPLMVNMQSSVSATVIKKICIQKVGNYLCSEMT